jgi:hypothetical protein
MADHTYVRSDWRALRGKVARLAQMLPHDSRELVEARRELRTLSIARDIERHLSLGPELDDEQRLRIVRLLLTGDSR